MPGVHGACDHIPMGAVRFGGVPLDDKLYGKNTRQVIIKPVSRHLGLRIMLQLLRDPVSLELTPETHNLV